MAATNKPTRETPASRRVEITPSGKPRQFETGGRLVTFVLATFAVITLSTTLTKG